MYAFGIDIGGTKIKIGLFDKKHKLLDKWSIDTKSDTLFTDLANSILDYCHSSNINLDDIIGYGIGVPGYVKNNIALNCVNLKWKNVDVIKEFQKVIGYKANVSLLNDAKLAAYGEYDIHNGKYNSIVFITLGTGIGSGIITDGVIQEGAHGLCGEIGHIIIDEKFNFKCSCGRTGCFETIASATGILRVANYLLDKNNIKGNKFTNTKEVFDKASEGDKIAIEAVDIASEYIAKVFSMLSLVINPDAFIIGGGVSAAGDFLLERIKKYYNQYCLAEASHVDILISELRNDAGIYGSSALIIKKYGGSL